MNAIGKPPKASVKEPKASVKSKLSAATDRLRKMGVQDIAEPVIPPLTEPERVVISEPNFQIATFLLVGEAPYMQHRFSVKALRQMEEKHRAGQRSKKGATREPRDFEGDYLLASYRFDDGGYGIPAAAFRDAAISACRLVGFKMTHAKLSFFVLADGLDKQDGTPLVRLIADEPECHQAVVRNETGVVDIRWRPMWRQWSVKLRARWDADQFSPVDAANLLVRAGLQVGVGEGRPDSPKSNGLGLGLWSLRG